MALASLEAELQKALPAGFICKYRYIRTPPKLCEPLFSALPGSKPEKTLLSSHFLAISIDSAALASHSSENSVSGDVLSFAIEVFVYMTARLTTIFVSKIDSTSYLLRYRPSPVQRTATTFLRWLSNECLHKKPGRKLVISLFARAQAQYLFPGSASSKDGHSKKHVLDDRQLIRWWARVLDPIFPSSNESLLDDKGLSCHAYMTVPGYEGADLKRSFFPPGRDCDEHWSPGHPLLELARARGLPEHASPRCLLPRFPDDPKARYIAELDEEIGIAENTPVTVSPSKRKSGRWTSVRDLRNFWEAMEFRQECSSGRVVGFLWLVISPPRCEGDGETESISMNGQDSLAGTTPSPFDFGSEKRQKVAKAIPPQVRPRKPLTGPIIPRAPRLKGSPSNSSNLSSSSGVPDESSSDGIAISKDGYDKAIQTLLNLDFGDLSLSIRSTEKWISEIMSIRSLNADFAVVVIGTAKADVIAPSSNGSGPVNNITSMVRKKRKTADDVSGANITGVGAAEVDQPAVNVLSASSVRKKAKATC